MTEVVRKPPIMLVATILFVGFHLLVPIQLPDAFLSWTGVGYLIFEAILALAFAIFICRLGTKGGVEGLSNDQLPPSQLPPHAGNDHH